MWDRNPVRLNLLHMLPAIAGSRGVGLAPLLARAGLAGDETFTSGVAARAQISTLLLQFSRKTGEPDIGLDLAAAADPVRLGLPGRALFAGRTLRECLVALARQMPALQGGAASRLEVRDGVARWHHCLADSDPEHARVLGEGIAAFMAGAVNAITGMAPSGLSVSLPHRAQAPASVYEDKLGAQVVFGSGDGIALSFDAGWLDRPNRLFGEGRDGGGTGPAEAAQRLAPEAVWRDDDAFLAAIGRLRESSALSGSLCLADTASSLGLSPRSLQRRLASLGTTFEAEVDAWRHRQARLHLADAGLPVASVARALGYRHAAHFVRAFRRWEDCTPLAFRRAATAEAAQGLAMSLAPNGN